MQEFCSNPNFNPDYIRSKSGAAAGLCGWVVNICKYFRIYQVVAPKRALLDEANVKLASAEKKLSGIRAKVADLRAKVAALEENLMKATEDKNNAIAQVPSHFCYVITKATAITTLIHQCTKSECEWNAMSASFSCRAVCFFRPWPMVKYDQS